MAIGDFHVIFEDVNPAINFIPTSTNKWMCVSFGGATNCFLGGESAVGSQDLLSSTTNVGSEMVPLVTCHFVFTNLLYARMLTFAGGNSLVNYSFVQVEE